LSLENNPMHQRVIKPRVARQQDLVAELGQYFMPKQE
jgi:hypothetical protein